ncbi:hypothetical protein FP507_07965 [Chlorobium phaeovibrioides]|uniref:Uncharacterized protein n=1 Tax=Chlorobium phaeovibrioides TaxID=1094 RepID=A0A5M8IGI6_CHLPH|nr:PLP-dependent transferase [Chlorobium phaeovibrioides]KAA6233399.1 hypothetical protein FP507_07965 [Chlorobium phaeovibrioides]
MTEEQLRASGLSEDLIRLSIGIEHPLDLINAFDRALENSLRRGGFSGGSFYLVEKKDRPCILKPSPFTTDRRPTHTQGR